MSPCQFSCINFTMTFWGRTWISTHWTVSTKYFHYAVFNRKKYQIEIYSQRLCHLFLPFHKEKSFHSCSHCQSYFFPIHLKLPALSTTYVWLALDSLAICHCQLKYWIYILFTYLKPAHYQRAKSNFTSSTKLSQYQSTRSLISMSDFFFD